MIEFKEHEKAMGRGAGPDLTPLIDMVFLLLIFFLLTSSLINRSVPVDPPRSDQGQASRRQELVVTIAGDGSLSLNGEPVSEGGLVAALRALPGGAGGRELFIQADRSVAFQRVVDVMDLAGRAGVEDISFLVEKRE